MPPRLRLGPIVGHTDHASSRVWIRTVDETRRYALQVRDVGVFPFVATEDLPEFRTAVAIADGLRADRRHRYRVLRDGRRVAGADGTFATMPRPGALGEQTFVVLSCSDQIDLGAWEDLAAYVEDVRPAFLLMIGDQVYLDQAPDAWDRHVDRPGPDRRRAMAEKYDQSWSRPAVAAVLANIPTYMLWDDHEVRDGWGSFAPDSPTLGRRFPLGAPIHATHASYFRDARDVYWHFQMVHNPVAGFDGVASPSLQPVPSPPFAAAAWPAMPYVLRSGPVAVVVVDSRGARDLWRDEAPVLGTTQWTFLEQVVDDLPTDVDAVVVVTAAPIVAMAPRGQSQLAVGNRTDDVELLRRGDEAGLRAMLHTEGDEGGFGSDVLNYASAFATVGTSALGTPRDVGSFQLSNVDDVRDQWSHHVSRPEQERLLRLALRARGTNRPGGRPRSLLFVGGDLHVGGAFRLDVTEPDVSIECLITSGISKTAPEPFPGLIGTVVDVEFEVADGIRAELLHLVNDPNYGVVTIVADGRAAQVHGHVVHLDTSETDGVRVKIERPRVLDRRLPRRG